MSTSEVGALVDMIMSFYDIIVPSTDCSRHAPRDVSGVTMDPLF